MNNYFFRLSKTLGILFVLYCSIGFAQQQQYQINSNLALHALTAYIDSVIHDSTYNSCFIGMKIVSLENGTVLYSKNSNKLFHPASNMKLLTTSTAVSLLDSDYHFTTNVFINSAIEKGIVNGDLFIEGVGDPLIQTSDFDSLALQLSKAGITGIAGDLVGDVSSFDDEYWGEGWMWDDEPEAYEAFISPLTVNANCIKFNVKPAAKNGERLMVEMAPSVNFYTITNESITSDDSTIERVDVTRPKRINTFTIIGRMALSDTAEEFDLSVWQPEMYFLNLLKERLTAIKIKISGKSVIGKVKRGKKVAELHHSIDSVLHQINKPSDNLAAELLLKTLGREKFGKPGSADKGLKSVKSYLHSCGIDTAQLILADGSGLSFYNQVSPDAITSLLKDQYTRKSFRRFYESLPLAGVEGTLKNR
ncbi:MAG: D-alanyl-D-alanine carboxypeptidase/D-alanyl-D-alanine-endopeptidase, partial [Bacteroidetes bacterium]